MKYICSLGFLAEQLMLDISHATLEKHKVVSVLSSELFLLPTLSRTSNADATPSVKDKLGPLPFSTKHLIFLIWYLVPQGVTCNMAYQLSGCSQEGLYSDGVDCHEPTEGQQSSWI